MKKVIKFHIIGLTAAILTVLLLSGMVFAAGSTPAADQAKSSAAAKTTTPSLPVVPEKPADQTGTVTTSSQTSSAQTGSVMAIPSQPVTPSTDVTASSVAASSENLTTDPSGWAAVMAVVSEDTNCDGVADSPLSVMNGVTVNLYRKVDGSWELLGTQITGPQSWTIFPFIPLWPGGWVGWNMLNWLDVHAIEVVPPAGYSVIGASFKDLGAHCYVSGEFLLQPESSLKVYKFVDMNENGIMDPGEPGMPGVTVIVDGGAQSGVTGGDGSITFSVCAGSHDVAIDESTAPGYYPTGPTSKTVEVPCGGEGVAYFGNAPYGSISGNKWDGQTEAGIPGVTIKLTGTTNVGGEAVNLETTTGGDGSYSFNNLKAGTYTVSEVVPDGMIAASPTSIDVTLAPGENATDKDFTNIRNKGKIEGYKFKDMDEDGIMDPDEVGIPGVRITLDGDADEAITDANGYFSFIVDPGTHTIAVDESSIDGYYPTTATSDTRNVTIEVVETVYFGNAPYGSISGHKWNDKNQNATYDTGDVAVAGMTVKLTGTTSLDNKSVSLSTTTDTDGSYSFTGLQAGTYTVSEVIPTGMQAVSDESVGVVLEVGEVVTDVDFFNTTKSTTPQPPTTTPTAPTTPTTAAATQPAVTTTTTTTTTPTSTATLPYTGLNKAPIALSAWFTAAFGLLLVGAGIIRRRRHADWLAKLAAAVPGRSWK